MFKEDSSPDYCYKSIDAIKCLHFFVIWFKSNENYKEYDTKRNTDQQVFWVDWKEQEVVSYLFSKVVSDWGQRRIEDSPYFPTYIPLFHKIRSFLLNEFCSIAKNFSKLGIYTIVIYSLNNVLCFFIIFIIVISHSINALEIILIV
jgi:hypothetical protein